jgi:hypothetical protein
MNQGVRWLLVVLGVVGLGYLGWLNRPTDERRIRKVIEGMAGDATFTGGEGNISRIAKIESLGNRFAVDAELHVDPVLPIESAVTGRDAIKGLLMMGTPQLGSVEVKVHDVQVTVTGDTEARVSMTASAKFGGKRGDFTAQEFDIRMVKTEGKWLVRRVDVVAGFRRSGGR